MAPHSCIDLLSTIEVPIYFLCSFFFRIHHPSTVLIVKLIYFIVVSHQKPKKKKEISLDFHIKLQDLLHYIFILTWKCYRLIDQCIRN